MQSLTRNKETSKVVFTGTGNKQITNTITFLEDVER